MQRKQVQRVLLLLGSNLLGLALCVGVYAYAQKSASPVLYPTQIASFEPSQHYLEPVLSAMKEPGISAALQADEQSMTAYSTYLERRFSLAQLGVVRVEGSDALNFVLSSGAKRVKEREELFFYEERFRLFLDDVQSELNRPKAEGRWDFETGQAIAGIDGLSLQRDKTTQAFLEALSRGEERFELVIKAEPSLSKQFEGLADFVPGVLVGRYVTVFSRKKNRTINVKLAAQALDGILLVPGADFSYNELVGERSEARGYREAPVIEQGQMVEGLGGGACQVSSTVHAAALFGGLEIVERYNHSLPSSYIGMGLDAVVAYPLLDLRIKNNLDRPVVLRVYTQEDRLIAEFLSDKEPPRSIFRKEVTDRIPYKEVLTFDPALAEGEVKITKMGRVGYRVSKGRIRWVDGKEQFEKMKIDIYQPQTQQVHLGPNTPYPPQPVD